MYKLAPSTAQIIYSILEEEASNDHNGFWYMMVDAIGSRPPMTHSLSFPMRRHVRLQAHINERRYGWEVHDLTESYLHPFFDKYA